MRPMTHILIVAGLLVASVLPAVPAVRAGGARRLRMPRTATPPIAVLPPKTEKLSGTSALKGMLPEGLRILIQNDPGLERVTVCLAVHVGSAQDMEYKQGAAALTAEMLFGALDPDGFLSHLGDDELPAELVSDEDATTLLFTVSRESFESRLEKLGKILAHTTFTAEQLEQARVAAIARHVNTAPASDAEVALRRMLYGPYSYHRQPDGTPLTLANVTREICQGYYSQYYRPNNSVLVVTGPVSPAEVRAILGRALGEWKYGYIPPSNPNEPQAVISGKLAHVAPPEGTGALMAGALMPHLPQADRMALEVWREWARAPELEEDDLPPVPMAAVRRHQLCDELRLRLADSEDSSVETFREAARARSAAADSKFEGARSRARENVLNERSWTLDAARTQAFGRAPEQPEELERALAQLTPESTRASVQRWFGAARWCVVSSRKPTELSHLCSDLGLHRE